jgi:uncharacterized membrane protein
MNSRTLPFPFLVISGLLSVTAPASAALKLCNQTSYIIYAAVASATKSELDAQGWTRVVPGDCATPLAEPLSAPAYFVYARTSQAHSGPSRAWGGNVPVCARDTNFSQRMKLPLQKCPGSGFYRMPFALIDRRGRRAWTTTFTESPALKTLSEAKRAGINRLLTDLGYRVNVPGDRARDQALEDFHNRAKLPADANSAELFAALETQATKAAAPAGYTVCNDTEGTFWAAIGLKVPKGMLTRGWWEVSPGACGHLATQPLNTDRVFLAVQPKGRKPLVSGPAKLCVGANAFELTSSGTCAGKGVHQAAFAITDTRGRTGYVAHVGENGLVAQAPPAKPPHK